MSVLEDRVATALSSLGFGQLGTSLFIDTMPTTPYDCIAVVRNGGVIDKVSPVRNLRFQILIRKLSSSAAASLANSINSYLLDSWNQMACYPGRVCADHEIGPPIRDPNNCTLYSLDYTVTTTSLR